MQTGREGIQVLKIAEKVDLVILSHFLISRRGNLASVLRSSVLFYKGQLNAAAQHIAPNGVVDVSIGLLLVPKQLDAPSLEYHEDMCRKPALVGRSIVRPDAINRTSAFLILLRNISAKFEVFKS
jgi:hypothetical protein